MQFKIHRDLAPAEVIGQLPSRYHARAGLLLLRGERYHLLLVEASKDGVVLSGAVRKALAALPEDHVEVIAVAPGLTEEGLELLRGRRATVLTLTDHPWTDASYQSVRQATRLPRESI